MLAGTVTFKVSMSPSRRRSMAIDMQTSIVAKPRRGAFGPIVRVGHRHLSAHIGPPLVEPQSQCRGQIGFLDGQIRGLANVGCSRVPTGASIRAKSWRTSTSSYEIYVYPDPFNSPPHFVTQPTLTHVVPGLAPAATGVVSPQVISLELEPGQTTEMTVSLEVQTYAGGVDPPEGEPNKLIVYNETDELVLKDMLLLGGSSGLVVTDVNRTGHTSGQKASTGYYVNNNDTYEMSQYGIVISSGNAEDYGSGPNTDSGHTTDFNGGTTGTQEVLLDSITGGGYSHYDATSFDVTFNLLPGYDTLTFNLVFGSEEYQEYDHSSAGAICAPK